MAGHVCHVLRPHCRHASRRREATAIHSLSGANVLQTCICLANVRPLAGFWRGLACCHLFRGIRPCNVLLSGSTPFGPFSNAGSPCQSPELLRVVGLANLVGHFCRAKSLGGQGGHASCSAGQVVGECCAEPAFWVAPSFMPLARAAAGALACPRVRPRNGTSQFGSCSCRCRVMARRYSRVASCAF